MFEFWKIEQNSGGDSQKQSLNFQTKIAKKGHSALYTALTDMGQITFPDQSKIWQVFYHDKLTKF